MAIRRVNLPIVSSLLPSAQIRPAWDVSESDPGILEWVSGSFSRQEPNRLNAESYKKIQVTR